MQNFQKFLLAVDRECAQTQGRWGQTFHNRLSEVRPGLSDALRGTEIDPFYKSSPGECQEAISYVDERWD